MAAAAQDIERRVSALEGDQKAVVAKYEALLQRVIDHMEDEEKRAQRLEDILKDIFANLKGLREKASDMDDRLEERIKEYIDDKYVGKLEAEIDRAKLDKSISKAYWVAGGISSAVPIIWLIYLIINNVNKIAGAGQ